MAARLAVLVEFAVFLISSTTDDRSPVGAQPAGLLCVS